MIGKLAIVPLLITAAVIAAYFAPSHIRHLVIPTFLFAVFAVWLWQRNGGEADYEFQRLCRRSPFQFAPQERLSATGRLSKGLRFGMLAEKSDHFSARIWSAWIGVGAVGAASRPRMPCIMHQPEFQQDPATAIRIAG